MMCTNNKVAFGFGIKVYASGTALEYWFIKDTALLYSRKVKTESEGLQARPIAAQTQSNFRSLVHVRHILIQVESFESNRK